MTTQTTHFADDATLELIARLERDKAELVEALERIAMRAHSEAQAEELEDVQRDVRHIHGIATSILAKHREQK